MVACEAAWAIQTAGRGRELMNIARTALSHLQGHAVFSELSAGGRTLLKHSRAYEGLQDAPDPHSFVDARGLTCLLWKGTCRQDDSTPQWTHPCPAASTSTETHYLSSHL